MASLEGLRAPLERLNLTTSEDTAYNTISTTYNMSTTTSGGSHSSGQAEVSSGYLNDYTDVDCAGPGGSDPFLASPRPHPQQQGQTRRRRQSLETVDTTITNLEDLSYLERYTKLTEPSRVPWGEQEVLNILREGRAKELSGLITVEMMQRLAYLLQRPLVRIAKEAHRLSWTFCKCGRDEIQTAMRVILSRSLADSCLQACHKASALYAMSGETFKQSKSLRCGLRFSVGKFHRWMVDSNVSVRIHEYAAIYLAACMENLLEEIVIITLGKQHPSESVLSLEILEFGLAANPELWGLLQPYEHLICGRNSSGILALPSSFSLVQDGGRRSESNGPVGGTTKLIGKNLEQSLLATCVGSLSELGDLVSRMMHQWYNKIPVPGATARGRHHPISWGPSALQTLYYYTRCSQLAHADNPNTNPPSVHLHQDRPYAVLPPLVEWVRVAAAHTEHRHSWVVDADDIRQAARLLLPAVDCPPRHFGPDESVCVSRHMDAHTCAAKYQQDVAFRMLDCGRSDMVPEALKLLGKDKVNTVNEQGLTPLMYACIRGDEAMVQMLLDAGAAINLAVPSDVQKYPCIHTDTRHWTALTFATVHCHLSIVQLLLERGANVEGSVRVGEENYSETPLQLAAAAGHFELVCLLLAKGADPYLNTIHKNGVSYTYSRGGYSAFALAATHGHRNVLRKLLSHPVLSSPKDVLSLEEILAEGTTDTFKNRYNKAEIPRTQAEQVGQTELRQTVETTDSLENVYVTIEEVFYEDSKLRSQTHGLQNLLEKLNKAQLTTLQEAKYHASENGFLDIALELRNLGVPWTFYTWTQCLSASFNMRRKTIIQCLIKDFSTCRHEDINDEFIYETLPLMFDVLRTRKQLSEAVCGQMASLLSELYGHETVPMIQELRHPSSARIDPRFVNNSELSDVQFLIEGKLFYAHRIILVNASNRFRAMLSKKFSEGNQTCIELNDVTYKIFEYIMQYLYNGGAGYLKVDPGDVLELMGAANFFLLDGLQRHCEVLCARRLNFDNCISIYKHAKLYSAMELLSYCEAFFLQNLPQLLASCESFRKMAFSSKLADFNLLNGMVLTLSHQLNEQMKVRSRKAQPPQVPKR